MHVIDQAAKPYFYSTKGDRQRITCAQGTRLSGAMDEVEMARFCREQGIRLLVDAAHPFAIQLHRTIAAVATRLEIPVIRYERRYPPRDKRFTWCEDYADAIRRLEADGVERLLALSGVNTIRPLKPYWEKHDCRFRILDRQESLEIATAAGFPRERLVFYPEGAESEAEVESLLKQLHPQAILTKESGTTGFFQEKTTAAIRQGVAVYVIKRPALPGSFYVVYGEEGLRKQIERLLPEFFPLHSGYTTGACATAAARAALLALLTGQEQQESQITLPSGEPVVLPVAHTEWDENGASCTVIKEAGDDPDVTNHSRIIAHVSLEETADKEQPPRIHFVGGEGIGTVTLPGLGLEVGEPAINPTPRRMITQELNSILSHHCALAGHGAEVTVTLSVPGGAELARQTFNPKLGIVGGISIIGTSGIVRPFSADALVASLRKEESVARAIGCETLVLNSGAKSERFLKAYIKQKVRLDLPPQAYVHYGNFIGETLRIARELGFQRVILGIMLGKAVKLAAGALDTHSKKVVMDKTFLKTLAVEAGCSPQAQQAIDALTLARELWETLSADDAARFFPLLLRYCQEHCATCFDPQHLTLALIAEDGTIRYDL